MKVTEERVCNDIASEYQRPNRREPQTRRDERRHELDSANVDVDVVVDVGMCVIGHCYGGNAVLIGS